MTRVELFKLSNSLITVYFRSFIGSASFCFQITIRIENPFILAMLKTCDVKKNPQENPNVQQVYT